MQARLIAFLAFAGVAAAADTPLERLPPADCPSVLSDLAVAEDTVALPLVTEAVRRHCAAIGGIEMPTDLAEEGVVGDTRKAAEPEDLDAKARLNKLRADAAFYLETAQQVDPDAANDLLRRLLGPDPEPD